MATTEINFCKYEEECLIPQSERAGRCGIDCSLRDFYLGEKNSREKPCRNQERCPVYKHFGNADCEKDVTLKAN